MNITLRSYDFILTLHELAYFSLREMSNFVEFTGPWYSSTLGESWIGTRRVREREVS